MSQISKMIYGLMRNELAQYIWIIFSDFLVQTVWFVLYYVVYCTDLNLKLIDDIWVQDRIFSS